MSIEKVHTIRYARVRIAHPDAFTKHGYALDAAGMACTPKSSVAVRWCIEGAIYASDGVPEWDEYIQSLGISERKFRSVYGWECVHMVERFVEGRKRDLARSPHHVPMLRVVVALLSHAEVLQLLDDVIGSGAE